MSLVPSLLQAIVSLDGDALVIHVGEKPYVVAPGGQVELATRGLTLEAVNGIVQQLLPVETRSALDEFGAIQYEIPARPDFRHEHFTVVAARGGDDVWVEIRRRKTPDDDHVPVEMFSTPEPIPAHDPAAMRADESDLEIPEPEHLWPDRPPIESAPPLRLPASIEIDQPPKPQMHIVPARPPVEEPVEEHVATPTPPPRPPVMAAPVAATPPPPVTVTPVVAATAPPPPLVTPTVAATPPPPVLVKPPVAATAQPPAVVVPMARSPIRPEMPTPLAGAGLTGLDRLLRVAAARGASTLYLASQARPSIRVDGEILMLDEPALSASDVESQLIDLMPERNREALRSGVGTEWICDVPEVGRVRCMSFRDHRGAGGIFRMMPVRAISADQLGLSREIQALAAEPEGLVLVAGPRSSGKSTLLSAFVDLINRSRRDHVITIETEIKVVHENRSSLVSQREVRGDNDEMLAVVRAAIRENPDVLVIEELRTADVMTAVLDAANSGHLVIGALPAHTATAAVDRIIDLYPPDYRRHVQLALAESLRGIVAQVLVRKPGGGRLAAREVLLNTSAVASVIAEGKTSQLPLTLESGRRYGMVPLNDALVGFVQSGAIDAREAYRRAADRAGFLTLLKRQGIDTSFVERLA